MKNAAVSFVVDQSAPIVSISGMENDGRVIFTIPEGIESQVQIICTDYAAHADGTTNEYNEIC